MIIILFIIGIGGLCPNSGCRCHTFGQQWVTIAFDDGLTKECGQIIKYDHYHVHHWYRGSMSQFWVKMPHILTVFWLLLLLMMVQHKNMVRSSNMIIIMFIMGIGGCFGPERISVSNQIIP